jgi:ribosomal protein S12 methylthiotransferase accessory factor YcaO
MGGVLRHFVRVEFRKQLAYETVSVAMASSRDRLGIPKILQVTPFDWESGQSW